MIQNTKTINSKINTSTFLVVDYVNFAWKKVRIITPKQNGKERENDFFKKDKPKHLGNK